MRRIRVPHDQRCERVRLQLPEQVQAVLLTHGHSDHVGIVETVRTDAPAPVYLHEADAEMARTAKPQ